MHHYSLHLPHLHSILIVKMDHFDFSLTLIFIADSYFATRDRLPLFPESNATSAAVRALDYFRSAQEGGDVLRFSTAPKAWLRLLAF